MCLSHCVCVLEKGEGEGEGEKEREGEREYDIVFRLVFVCIGDDMESCLCRERSGLT